MVAERAQGKWICIDGVEGTGKTTITAALAADLPIAVAPEFSQAPFGVALRQAVSTSPHYISASPLGQSLVFLGDFHEVYTSAVVPQLSAGVSVVSDRGYVSKYSYQEVVLADTLGMAQARQLLDEVFAQLPPPDLTIYLTAPAPVVRARLLRRDEFFDAARAEFIDRAARSAARYLERSRRLRSATIDTNRPADKVISDVKSAIQDLVSTTRHS